MTREAKIDIIYMFLIILATSSFTWIMCKGYSESEGFIYRVDPKQSYYLIENNNYGEKTLDTVPFGHLEEYIATDNL